MYLDLTIDPHPPGRRHPAPKHIKRNILLFKKINKKWAKQKEIFKKKKQKCFQENVVL